MSLVCLMSVTLMWHQTCFEGIQLFKVETLQLDGSKTRDYEDQDKFTDFFQPWESSRPKLAGCNSQEWKICGTAGRGELEFSAAVLISQRSCWNSGPRIAENLYNSNGCCASDERWRTEDRFCPIRTRRVRRSSVTNEGSNRSYLLLRFLKHQWRLNDRNEIRKN